MASLHLLDAASGKVLSHPVPVDAPLRLCTRAHVPVEAREGTGGGASDGDWAIAVVPFGSGASRARAALVARDGAAVWVGSRRVDGVLELRDGDRIFLDRGELLFSTDALPVPLSQSAGATCELCCEGLDGALRTAILACPLCGAPACDDCWERSRTGRCASPACPQPAALDRDLWRPSPGDFTGVLGAAGVEEAAP